MLKFMYDSNEDQWPESRKSMRPSFRR
jgi:hypothetical protein